MPFLGRLLAVLGLDNTEFNRKFDQSTNRIQRAGQAMEDLGRRMTYSVSVPMIGLGTAALKAAGGLEAMQIGFTTLLKSGEASKQLFGEITDYALKTQFSIEGVGNSSRKLLAVGFAANEVLPSIRKIGDAVTAIGGGQVEMDRIVRAMMQMTQKSKASAEEINQQLAEIGINGWKYLAEYFGKTTGEIQDMVKKGLIEGRDAARIIIDGMGAEFAGASDKMVGSINQTFQNMQESIRLALADIGNVLGPYFRRFKTEFFDPFLEDVRALSKGFAGLPQGVQDVALKYALAFTAAPIILAALGSMVRNVGSLRVALAGLGIKMGPIGWTISAMLLLYPVIDQAFKGLFADKRQRTEQEAFFDDMLSGINNINSNLRKTGEASVREFTLNYKKHMVSLAEEVKDIPVFPMADEKLMARRMANMEKATIAAARKMAAGIMKFWADSQKYFEGGLFGGGVAPEIVPTLNQGYTVLSKYPPVLMDVASGLAQMKAQMAFLEASTWQFIPAGESFKRTLDVIRAGALLTVYDARDAMREADREARRAFDNMIRYVDNYARRISRDFISVIDKTSSLKKAFQQLALDISKALMEFAMVEGLKLLVRNLDGILGKLGTIGKVLQSWGGQSVLVTGASTAAGAATSASGTVAAGASKGAGSAVSGAMSGAMGWVTGISSAVSAVFEGLQYFQQRRMEQDIGRIEVTSRSIFNQTLALQDTANRQAATLQDIYGYFWGPQLTILAQINDNLVAIKDGSVLGTGSNAVRVNARDFMDSIIRELKMAGGYAFV